jgi:hypothetical protein
MQPGNAGYQQPQNTTGNPTTPTDQNAAPPPPNNNPNPNQPGPSS